MMNAPSKRPMLPDSWVERIFDRMQGLYGALWVDRWRSGETIEQGGRLFDRGLLLAKATWGQELAGFVDQPARIHRALDACRHRNLPPTLPEFLDLCRQGVSEVDRALPPPRMSAEEVAPRIAEVSQRLAQPRAGSLSWASQAPAPGCRGPWESAIIKLAEQGDQRFVRILAEHVANGVIRGERAKAALDAAEHGKAAA